ncbi:MAG: 2-polyprenyl-3-methyl-5-hydroxy-6-metoxy-1,4-benzoquinol methylase [Planctomycetota bacterium]
MIACPIVSETTEQSDVSRRMGDEIQIEGDYQHRAITSGPPIQRHWHQSKLELLDWFFTPKSGLKALDVGCGSGVISDGLGKRGLEVTGVDANKAAQEYASKTFGRDHVRFLLGYLDELELPESTFDVATCLEVIEHVYPPQIEKLLGDLARLLKPGGRLLITTPNYRGLWPMIEWAADRFASTADMDVDQHVTRIHRKMLRGFLEAAGFEVEKMRCYCTFAPFAAPISQGLAKMVDRGERAIDLPFGSLLAAVARVPGGEDD